MSNAIQPISSDYDELAKIASAMVKSGYFQDARDVSQAVVKILAGREMGIGAFQSMQSIYIISGRPSMSANLMAAKVKASGRYDYRVITLEDNLCEIAFYQDSKEIGRSSFSADEARKAGTKNMDRYPRNMLFSRAMSNGVRWYCPDVVGSAAVYTPEELGATVDADGAMIDIPAAAVQPANVIQADATNEHLRVVEEAEPAEVTVSEMSWETAREYRTKENQLYIDIDTPTLSHMANSLNRGLAGHKYDGDKIVEAQQKLAAIRCILAKRDAAPPLNVK